MTTKSETDSKAAKRVKAVEERRKALTYAMQRSVQQFEQMTRVRLPRKSK